MNKPKIGLLTTAIDKRKARGTALVAKRLLDYLDEYNDRFDFVLVHHSHDDDPIYTKYPEVIIPRLPGPFNKQILNEFVFWLRGKHSFDIFHYLHPRVWPSYLFTRARKVMVTGIEGGHVLKINRAGNENKIFRFTSQYLNFRMDAVIASSDSGRTEIIEEWHVPAAKVHKILLGVDPFYAPVPDVAAARKRLQSAYDLVGPYLLVVSRFDPHKNILRLLEAFEQFRCKFPDHTLALVGGPHTPGYSEKVEARIKEIQTAGGKLVVIPFVEDEDMPAIYTCAEMLVYPSLHEGFGLPVVEAMACGAPVVASSAASLPEVVGDAGILIDPFDTQSLVDGMEKVAGDPELRKTLRERGMKQAKQFDWQKTAKETMDLYSQLLPEV